MSFDVDEKLIRKLAKLLDETGLNEIEYEAEERRIRVIARASTQVMAAAAISTSPGAAAPTPPATAIVAPTVGQVTSPMVGTAYLSSQPGATPFVKIGDRVNKDQTIMIIEAMKVMNPIPAPNAGIVKSVLVSDGQPVEFGEVLMVVE